MTIVYMIDIEALGTQRDCVIVSVGIVKFNIRTGETLDTKYWELGLGEQQRRGRTIDVGTVMWWSNQSSEALKALQIKPDRTTIEVFIREFNKFIEEKGYYSAKGTNYDLEIIGDLYRLYGQQAPFKYSKWLDARVYYFIGKQLGILPKYENTLAHNALADAEFQTKVVCTIHAAMQKHIKRQPSIKKEKDRKHWLPNDIGGLDSP